MELLCPCGNGPLTRAVTRSRGKNFSRPYYKCPGSNLKNNGIPDCSFYSFEDELKPCPCGRGFCRNKYIGQVKFWCCCNRGYSCGFREKVVQTWQPPSSLSQSPSAQSQSSPPSAQSQSSRSPEVTPISGSGGASSSYTPESSNSQLSPSRKTNVMLLRALQVTREKEAIYLDIIKDLAKVSVDD